jgi:hypothetical protein
MATATLLGAAVFAGPVYAESTSGKELSAQTVMPPTPAEHHTRAARMAHHAKASSQDQVEARISSLHHKLQISAAQEPQWAIVAQAMRDNAKSMDALIKERAANGKTMTAVDDLRSYEKLAAAHEDGLNKFIPVFQALYDSLSVDQKKSADAAFRSHGPHDGRRKI